MTAHRFEPVRAPDNLCPYCPAHLDEEVATSEHVIPRSWYPSTTPNDVPRPQVVDCQPCNKRFDRIEQRVFRAIGFTSVPSAPESQGFADAIIRSIDPVQGRSKDDAIRRFNAREALRRRLTFVGESASVLATPSDGPAHEILWNGIWVRGRYGVRFEPGDLNAIAEKIVRGLFLWQTGRRLPLAERVETQFVEPRFWPGVGDIVKQCGLPVRSLPPAFKFWFGWVPEGEHQSIAFVYLWRRFLLFGATGTANGAMVMPGTGGLPAALQRRPAELIEG
jgi:hypothetical protein